MGATRASHVLAREGQPRAMSRQRLRNCAPPPQVAEHLEKTTLFARCTLGRALMPGSSVSTSLLRAH